MKALFVNDNIEKIQFVRVSGMGQFFHDLARLEPTRPDPTRGEVLLS